ncbi:MAG: hypothetical protein NXI31_09300 [bacterium]|nr:hypothetical protein [bacterium]
MRRSSLLLLLLAAGMAGCASTTTDPFGNKVAVPDEEARQAALAEAEKQRRKFENVLLKLDQSMESYSRALANRGANRADLQRERLQKLIRDLVLDRGSQAFNKPVDSKEAAAGPMSIGDNFYRLRATAIDGSNERNQGIALAALGFSDQPEVMSTIVQGAQLDKPYLIDRAVFGLAMLRAPDTPPGVLAAIVENEKLSDASRTQAAWALYRIQERSSRGPEVESAWQRLAARAGKTMPAGALVQIVRGLGLTRDSKHANLVVPHAKSNVPLLRMATANALARMNAQEQFETLLDLIGPGETVPNVRLAARKALRALAGQVDYVYDVEAWRKAFERK